MKPIGMRVLKLALNIGSAVNNKGHTTMKSASLTQILHSVSPCLRSIALLVLLVSGILRGADKREFRIGERTWKCYSNGRVTLGDDNVFTIVDDDEKAGAGLVSIFPAEADRWLSFSGEFKARDKDVSKVFVQARFMPQKKIVQQEFSLKAGEDFRKVSMLFPPPPKGAKEVWFYIYVHPGKSAFLLRNFDLGTELSTAFDRAKLKKRPQSMTLTRETPLVLPADGSADEFAALLEQSSGIQFKTVKDISRIGQYTNAILVGNRDNNPLIAELYDRYHLIADSYYPGPGGHQLRTLFRPFDDGRDYLLVSGSDAAGTAEAVRRLAAKWEKAPAQNGSLRQPFLWDVKLSPQYLLPPNTAKAHTFDESEGYGTRFFGWNVLARNMALFYATGDTAYARRFLELALPRTPENLKVLEDDGGTFKLPQDPLAGPYHYCSVMANLYWEMIADHPIFSDEERAQVTEAMHRQFLNWRDTGNGCGVYNIFSPSQRIGNRHQQWAAISLYTVARYLNKVTPANEYDHALKAAEHFFSSILKYRYVDGEGGNLTWYPSGIEPVPLFMLLAGWKNDAPTSGLTDLYRSLETLCGNQHGRRVRRYVPLSFLRRTAYLLGDNSPLEFEKNLAEHFQCETFRLGQAFAPPAEGYKQRCGTHAQEWNFIKPSTAEQPTWQIPFKDTENAFSIASWRNDNERGDLLILDGHLDHILRQPLHAMTIFTLTINELPLLAGYRNQLWARHEGLSFSSMPSNAHFDCAMTLGNTAGFASTLPIQQDLLWQRSLLKCDGFCLFADTLSKTSQNASTYSIDAIWEFAPNLDRKLLPDGRLRLLTTDFKAKCRYCIEALNCRYAVTPANGDVVHLYSVPTLLFKARNPGDKLTVEFDLPDDFSGKAQLKMYAYRDRGSFSVSIDDKVWEEKFTHYTKDAEEVFFELGEVNLKKGHHQLTFETIAPGAGGGFSIAFSALGFLENNTVPREGGMAFSDQAEVRLESNNPSSADLLSGNVAVRTFKVDLSPGADKTFFTLLSACPIAELACAQLNNHTALLKLPEPAVAVQGRDDSLNIAGQLVLLSSKRLSGMQTIIATELFSAERPVDIVWDFNSGTLEISSSDSCIAHAAEKTLKLRAGRNTFQIKPPAAMLTSIQKIIAEMPWPPQKTSETERKLSGTAKSCLREVQLNAFPTDMIEISGDRLAVAAGRSVRVFTTELAQLGDFKADSTVGKLAWAPESKLLLAGCEDGKVIAFDVANGARIWEHSSVEADGLLETGANWYLKSSFPGIYGLATGHFTGTGENIFVGSASTLEVLSADGKLIRREKILWGPVQHFALFPVNGIMRLAMSQFYPGSDYLTCFAPDFHKELGYNLPPTGCLNFPSWAGINRTGINAVDLDDDGQLKVVSGLNGVWNRIIVWTADGTPVHEVSFGPGDSLKVPAYGKERMERRFLCDVLVTATPQGSRIVAATSEALILFDGKLSKLWSRPLPSPPVVTALWSNGIVTGLRNGQLCFYTLEGELTHVVDNPAAWAALLVCGKTLYAADCNGTLRQF